MIRSRRKLVLGLLALVAFLAAGSGDVLVRHPCPHHDALPGQQVAGEALGHTGHGAASDAGQPEHGDAAGCTCLGHCATGGEPPAGPANSVAYLRAPEATPTPEIRTAHPDPARAPVPHKLHQPNAPPFSA